MEAKDFIEVLPAEKVIAKIRSVSDGVEISWSEGQLAFDTFLDTSHGEWEIIVELSASDFADLPKTKDIQFLVEDGNLVVKAGEKKKEFHPISSFQSFPDMGDNVECARMPKEVWKPIVSLAEIASQYDPTQKAKYPELGSILISWEKTSLFAYGCLFQQDRTLILKGIFDIVEGSESWNRVRIPTEAIARLSKEESVLLTISGDSKYFRLSGDSGLSLSGHNKNTEIAEAGGRPKDLSVPKADEYTDPSINLSKSETRELAKVLTEIGKKYSDDSLITIEFTDDGKLSVIVDGTEERAEIKTKAKPKNKEGTEILTTTVVLSLLLDMAKAVLAAKRIMVIFPGAVGQVLQVALEGVGLWFLLSTVKKIIHQEEKEELPDTVGKRTKVEKVEISPATASEPEAVVQPSNNEEAIASLEQKIANARKLLGKKIDADSKKRLEDNIKILQSLIGRLRAQRSEANEVQDPQTLKEVYDLCIKITELQQQVLTLLNQRYPLPPATPSGVTYIVK